MRTRLLATAAMVVAAGAVTIAQPSVATSPHTAAHPAAPTAVRAYQLAHGVQLTWANPRKGFAAVVLRYQRGSSAPVRDKGQAVRLRAHATSAVLRGLAANARYGVSIWTRDAAGHYSTRVTTHFTTAPAPTPAGRGTITGTVTDTQGDPLAGVVVTAYARSAASFSARTDAHGQFSVHAPAGAVDVYLDATDATGGSSDATGYFGAYEEVVVRSGATSTLRSKVESAGAITGRVVDAAGHPVAGYSVQSAPVSEFVQTSQSVASFGYGGFAPATTGADGTFRLRGVGAYASRLCVAPSVSARASSCLHRSIAVTPSTSRAVGDVVVVVGKRQPVGSLRVAVFGPAGQRLSGVFVFGGSISDGGGTDVSGVTNASGVLNSPGVPVAKYQICSDGAPYSTAQLTTAGFLQRCVQAVVTAGHTTTAALHLPAAGAAGGTVRGPTGRELAGAEVDLDNGRDSESASADRYGHFVVAGLPSGSYRVCAEGGGSVSAAAPTGATQSCLPGKVLVTAGRIRTGIDLLLPTGAALSGTVTTTSGHGVADIDVSVGSDFIGNGSEANTDAHGRYAVGGLAKGSYPVCAQSSTYYSDPLLTCSRAVLATGKIAHLDLRLPKFGKVTMTAQDSDGVGLTGANAVLLKGCKPDPESDPEDSDCAPLPAFGTRDVDVVASAMTDADGSMTVTGIAAGHYALCLLGYDATSATTTPAAGGYTDTCTSGFSVAVTDGAITTAALTLAQGATFSGRVTDTSGKPIAGVRVLLPHSATPDPAFTSDDNFHLGQTPHVATTGADGTYSVHSAIPGPQTICFDASAAGTDKAGFRDQCIGGAVNHTNDGKTITLVAGANPDENQVLKSGPSRVGEGPNVRARTARVARSAPQSHIVVLNTGAEHAVRVARQGA